MNINMENFQNIQFNKRKHLNFVKSELKNGLNRNL